jgi:16S rRNA (guanine(527)-N(7))-methyltransferase RsmG
MADIGSGAGFPGLVLAAALPGTRVTLIESRPERTNFLRGAIEVLGLTDAAVVGRAVQAWPAGIETFDLVTARNVAPLNTMLELAAPLLVVGGAAVLWMRRRVPRHQDAHAEAAAAATGLRREEILNPAPKRHLYVYVKEAETPDRFPRPRRQAVHEPIRAADVRALDPVSAELTSLERELLRLMAGGTSFHDMAERLDLPLAVVRREIRRARRKLGASTRHEALERAERAGLFDATEEP